MTVRPPLVAAVVLCLAGCLSPEAAREEADDQVYALVAERRAEIFGDELPFSLEPPTNSLRQQVLRRDISGIKDLDLLTCLVIAAENSREFQSEKERLYLAALDLTLERWRFGWQFNLGGGASANGSGLDDGAAGLDGDGGLSRLFGSGGQLVTNVGASLFRAISSGDGWDAISDIGFSFTQPLLRGAAREAVLEPLTQAERDLVYAMRDFESFRRDFSLDVARRYYNLLVVRQQVANEQLNVDDLEVLSARNQAFAEAGKLNEVQAAQAAEEVLDSRNRVITTEANFAAQLDSFKLFLGLPIEAELELASGILEQLAQREEAPDFHLWSHQELVDWARNHRYDLLNALEQLADADRRTRIAADDLRAGLGVTTSLGASSAEGRPLDFSRDRAPWSIGLDLDLPVDQLPERNAYRRSLINFEAQRRSYENEFDAVLVDIRDTIRNTFSTRESYKIQLNSVSLNERRVLGANMNLEAGRVETRDVTEAQRALLNARNRADSELVAHTLALLDLYRQMELLTVDESGISVDHERLQAFAPPAPAPDQEPRPEPSDEEEPKE